MWSASKPGADFIGLSELQRLAMKERFGEIVKTCG
jgi:hypothetical protein